MSRIHPTAIIAREAELGPDVEIGPYVVIEGPVRIGPGVRIFGPAQLCGCTEIGAECVIHPFAAVGGPPQDYAHKGERSYCRVGARTVIREGVTIHRGTTPESVTEVGADCMLMVNAHVAHNCRVGHHVVLVNGALLGGYVEVGDRATLGGGASVHQFVRIGEYAMLAGGTRLTQDLPPFMIVVERNVCLGLNRVGLRRNGFPSADIDELRWLHKELFRRSGQLRTSTQAIANKVHTPAGKRLVEFLLSDTRRTYVRWRAERLPAAESAV